MTSTVSAMGFRFAVAALAVSAMALAQVEVQRRTLVARQRQVQLVERKTAAIDQLNQLDAELARLSAPHALLKRPDTASHGSVD